MYLKIVRGATIGKAFKLEPGSNLIGRWDPDASAFPEIDLEHDDPEMKISRKHALLEWNGAALTIEDIGSLNGTFVNRGSRLEVGDKHSVKAGDEIIVGKTFLRLEEAE